MNDTIPDMRRWQLISRIENNQGWDKEATNTYLAPARLKTRTGRVGGTRYQTITISWLTFDEKFPVNTGEIACEDCEKVVNVKIETVTSDSLGCINGFARLIAVETEPGVWRDNTLPS